MKCILQDLSAEKFAGICPTELQGSRIITNEENRIAHCIGCFGCWLKTPGSCVIEDGYGNLGPAFASAKEVIIITKIQYGGYSPFIKNLLDRNIGYLLPFFKIKKDEMHHEERYPNRFKLTVIGYGEDITPEELTTFKGIVAANALNFNAEGHRVITVETPEEIGKILEAIQ